MKTKLILGTVIFMLAMVLTPTSTSAGLLEPDNLTLAVASDGTEVYNDLIVIPVTIDKEQGTSDKVELKTETITLPAEITDKYEIKEAVVTSTFYKTYFDIEHYHYAMSLYDSIQTNEDGERWDKLAYNKLRHLPNISHVSADYNPQNGSTQVKWHFSTQNSFRPSYTQDKMVWYLPAMISWYGTEKSQTKSLAQLDAKLKQ